MRSSRVVGSKILAAFDTQERVRVMIAFAPPAARRDHGAQRSDTPAMRAAIAANDAADALR